MGYVGFIWAKLRSDVMRMTEYKTFEAKILNFEYDNIIENNNIKSGKPDNRVEQF